MLVPPIGIFAALEVLPARPRATAGGRAARVRVPRRRLLGAVLANLVDENLLRRVFATFMLFIALQMPFSAKARADLAHGAADGGRDRRGRGYWHDRSPMGRRTRCARASCGGIPQAAAPRHLDEKVEYHI